MRKEMVHIALRTGFTFKRVFGHLDRTIQFGAATGYIGIADIGSTHAHPMLEQRCNEILNKKATAIGLKKVENVKPIYGVRLTVVEDATERVPPRGQFGSEYIFIAKSQQGLSEIYGLVALFYENFYYRGNISLEDVNALSDHVVVISENPLEDSRVDYIALTTSTPKKFKESLDKPKVAIVNNYYPEPEDYNAYELFTFPKDNNKHTYAQHVLTTQEWRELYRAHPEREEAIENTHRIAEMCSSVTLLKADLVKYKGHETLDFMCKIGANRLKINLKDKVYKARYEREMGLILERGFQDYFLIVANLISRAKKRMLVGPGRGSSGGSLVCYLLGITEGMDPIKHDLMFERFIDVNRSDLPDIDIDFPDRDRGSIISQLVKEYGEKNVKQIANISTMQPRIAIGEFAKSLGIPKYETDELKTAIITRSGGDARAQMKIGDTFDTTEIGKKFLEKYPSMREVAKIEAHPRHSSVHAAGVIICNEPVEKYCGINARDNTAMVDRKTSEYLNLLKVDILGLRTLAILEDCAKLIGMDYREYYKLDINCKRAFSIFNTMRLSGIFQFEGYSLASLTRKMQVESFEDIVAITALARPGALYSGGAARYIKYRTGMEEPVFMGPLHEEITQNTFGIVVYQEQILRICREIGDMSWQDVNDLRRALSKSLGKEYFNRYKEKFVAGAKKHGYSDRDCDFIWSEVENGGAYAFNRSHAFAYALISYWCAYIKARHPKEFFVANLNHAKGVASGIKLLRDATVNEGIEYIPIDPDESEREWSINSAGKIVGGLTNIKGIGVKTANKIIKARKNKEKLPPSVIRKLLDPKTDYDILFPCEHFWGDIYARPEVYGLSNAPSKIIDVQHQGRHLIIGRLMGKNVRDLNEYVNLQKRGGEVYHDHTIELAIKVEDDTDSIMCSVGRYDYERIGRDISENGVIEEDWYLIAGSIKFRGRYLAIKEIMKLDLSFLEK